MWCIACSPLLIIPSWTNAQQTSANPDWGSCERFSETEQSANPVFILPLEISQGLIAGRSSRTPYTFSVQMAGMYDPLPHTRRFKIGPTVALTYPNPDFGFLAGLRMSYRVFRPSLSGTDLGTGIDGYLEGAWESPDAALLSAGVVVDASIVQLLGRVSYDFRRGESRWMLGLGRPIMQRFRAAPRSRENGTSRWRDARTEFAINVRNGISASLPDGALLCDNAALGTLAAMVPQLNRDADNLTLDGLVDRFRAKGLLLLVARLEAQPTRWRDNAVVAMNQGPPVSEGEAVKALVEELRTVLRVDFSIRS